jgi:hypothetical protein
MAEGGRKRVFYFSFEELYDAPASNPQDDAGVLAVQLLKYYGFSPLLAFTVATDAPQGASPIIFHAGNEENAIFQVLEQKIEENDDYYDAVEETIEEIDKDRDIEDESGLIGIIVFDGYETGIAIGYPT